MHRASAEEPKRSTRLVRQRACGHFRPIELSSDASSKLADTNGSWLQFCKRPLVWANKRTCCGCKQVSLKVSRVGQMCLSFGRASSKPPTNAQRAATFPRQNPWRIIRKFIAKFEGAKFDMYKSWLPNNNNNNSIEAS